MFIFTTSSMFPSAKALANRMQELGGKRVYVTTNSDSSLQGPAIRWGAGILNLPFPVINDGFLIQVSSNKFLFSQKMVELGIPVVEIKSGTPDAFPVVIRRTLTGFGGAGISICANSAEWASYGSSYWSQYRRFNPELGVHIVAGKILRVFKKVNTGNLPVEQYPIRNASRGYHFSPVDIANFPKLLPVIELFYSKFPIFSGRLDIGWDVDAKLYRIIEMNTAPCLTDNPTTLEAYAKAFLEVL